MSKFLVTGITAAAASAAIAGACTFSYKAKDEAAAKAAIAEKEVAVHLAKEKAEAAKAAAVETEALEALLVLHAGLMYQLLKSHEDVLADISKRLDALRDVARLKTAAAKAAEEEKDAAVDELQTLIIA